MRLDFKKPFELAIGEFDGAADHVEIPTPGGNVSGFIGDLEQQLGFAFANAMKLAKGVTEDQISAAEEKKEEQEEDAEAEAKTILTQLAMGDADMSKCYSVLKKCLTKSPNRAKINGNLAVTDGVFDMIPHPEIRRILGHYIVNFTNILD